VPHVAGREHAGHVRLHIIWISVEMPVFGAIAIFQQIRTGNQVARFIANDANFHGPLRVRHAPQTEKQPNGSEGLLRQITALVKHTFVSHFCWLAIAARNFKGS